MPRRALAGAVLFHATLLAPGLWPAADQGAGWALDYARLSEAVYHSRAEERDLKLLPEGWMRMREGSDWTGIRWAVYERLLPGGKTERALVFAGTNPADPRDWSNNIRQATGPGAAQYRRGLEIAQAEVRLKDRSADISLVIVGHSLGGGIGQYVAAMTGSRAVLFNAAALGWATMATIPRQLREAIGRSITHITMKNDPVHEPTSRLAGTQLGVTTVLEPAPGAANVLNADIPAAAIVQELLPAAARAYFRLPIEPQSLEMTRKVVDDRLTRHSMPAMIAAIEYDKAYGASRQIVDAMLSNRWQQAGEWLGEARRNGGSGPVVDWLSAHAALSSGDLASATHGFASLGEATDREVFRRWAESAVAAHGESPGALLLLGDGLVRAGAHREALAEFNRGLELAPGNAALLNARGSLHALAGNLPSAERDFSAAVRSDPAFADARANLGVVRLAAGRTGEAMESLQPVRGHPIAQHARGVAQMQVGQWESARHDFNASAPDLSRYRWARENMQRTEPLRSRFAMSAPLARGPEPAVPQSHGTIYWNPARWSREGVRDFVHASTEAMGNALSSLDLLKTAHSGAPAKLQRVLGGWIRDTSVSTGFSTLQKVGFAAVQDLADGSAGNYNAFSSEHLLHSRTLEATFQSGLESFSRQLTALGSSGKLPGMWRHSDRMTAGLVPLASGLGKHIGSGQLTSDAAKDYGEAYYRFSLLDANVRNGGRSAWTLPPSPRVSLFRSVSLAEGWEAFSRSGLRRSALLAGAPELFSLAVSRSERWGQPLNVEEWERLGDAAVGASFFALGSVVSGGNANVGAFTADAGKALAGLGRSLTYGFFESYRMRSVREEQQTQLAALNRSLEARGFESISSEQLFDPEPGSRTSDLVRRAAPSDSSRSSQGAGKVEAPRSEGRCEPGSNRRCPVPLITVATAPPACPGGGPPPCRGGLGGMGTGCPDGRMPPCANSPLASIGGGGRCPGGSMPPCRPFGNPGGAIVPKTLTAPRQPAPAPSVRPMPAGRPPAIPSAVKPKGVLLGAQVVEGSTLDFSEISGTPGAVESPAVEPAVLYIPTILYSGLNRGT